MKMIEIEAKELAPGMVLACPGDPTIRDVHTVEHLGSRKLRVTCTDSGEMSFGPGARVPVQAESVWLHGPLRGDLLCWATPDNIPPGALLEDEAGATWKVMEPNLRRPGTDGAAYVQSGDYVTITTTKGPFVLTASRTYKCTVTETVRAELREAAKVHMYNHYNMRGMTVEQLSKRIPEFFKGAYVQFDVPADGVPAGSQEQAIEASELRIGDMFYVGNTARRVDDIRSDADDWLMLYLAPDQRPWRLHKTDMAIIEPRASQSVAAQKLQKDLKSTWPSIAQYMGTYSVPEDDSSQAAPSLRELCCTCLAVRSARDVGGKARNAAALMAAGNPANHDQECPVSPKPGIHGGLCARPRTYRGHDWRWNAEMCEYQHPYAPAVDVKELAHISRYGARTPVSELMLQCFFEPPAHASEAPVAPNWDPYPGTDAELEIIASRR